MNSELPNSKCVWCKELFSPKVEHIAFGGLVYCTEECLAECVVDSDELTVDKVEEEMEYRP